MKFANPYVFANAITSPSLRRVWVEMSMTPNVMPEIKSPSLRRVWVEMAVAEAVVTAVTSPSLRRVWVEMCTHRARPRFWSVTLLAEGVG